MKFNPNIEKEKYIEFEEKSSKAHFMQTYAWGQFAIKGKKQIPLYVGMEDDNGNILCEALFLKKNTPLGYSYIYCPRGYVIDFNNIELLKEFTNALKNYMRENKIIYIKIDPDLKYEDIDEEAKPLKDGFNNYKLFNSLLDLGYIHKGFYKLYEGNQPRYTFRIDLTKSKDEIDNNISKSFLKSVKRSYNYNLEIDNETNIDLFCELNKYNSSKDDFKPYSKEYYEEFTKQFIEAKAVKYFNVWINKKEVLDNLNNQLSELNEKIKIDNKHTADLNNQITRVKQDIDTFSKLEKDKEMVCSLICVYAGDKAWSLYIGSNDIANTTFAVSRCYYDSIMDAKENGYKIYDLFGTVGDPHTNFKNLAHLHDYKRKFGGEYIEFMGEFDLVNNKFLYNILPILLKIYRSIKK
jgi:peptidoglycan pentaglycine glycine transferase (the first glycine)